MSTKKLIQSLNESLSINESEDLNDTEKAVVDMVIYNFDKSDEEDLDAIIDNAIEHWSKKEDEDEILFPIDRKKVEEIIKEKIKLNEAPEEEVETTDTEEVVEEPAEDSESELSEEDRKVQDVINELKSKNNMYAWVIEDILDDSEDYSGDTLKDRVIARCNEIYEHGCVSGTVNSLIYYSDTTKFFDDNWDDIYDMIEELDDGGVEPMEAIKRHCSNTEILMGTDQVKNWIAWMCYEEITYQLMEKLEEL